MPMYDTPALVASNWAAVSIFFARKVNRSNGYEPEVLRCTAATSTARRSVAQRGAGARTERLGAGMTSERGSGVWRSIHSRHAATTMELTGIPVRAEA